MLTHIQIRDFAIIDMVELELGKGLTVLTGETGAGKSILVDALLLASGGRAGAEVVRHGSERAEVTATFTLANNHAANQWFKDQEMEVDDECVLRRIVTRDGRSRAYVNGQAIAVQSLRQLGELLLEVHGQMEYQSLMKKTAQRRLLDNYAVSESKKYDQYDALLDTVGAEWKQLKSLREQQASMIAANQDRTARLELLRYHVTELKALDLKPGEVAELTSERQRVAQSGRLAQGVREAMIALRESEDGNAEQNLSRALAVTKQLTAFDNRLEGIARMLDESLITLRESVDEISRYEADLEIDPARQEWLEQRLAAIEALARKHRVETNVLPALMQNFEAELHHLENISETLEQIDKQVTAAQAKFIAAAKKLSALRKQAAADLSERIAALMQGLGMPGGKFVIDIKPRTEADANESGLDDIEFLVSANPGQPPQSLAKVASGGELSRMSLAVQVAAVESTQQPCLVFDEVDAGVGGGVAEIVGRQLRALGARSQVLCVTHLPQVASQAHAHVHVSKLTDGKTTRTSLHTLTHEDRVEEVARMLGGIEITDTAREHAREMLQVGATEPSKKAKRK
jgi:DNA repair protein RecN (Recombination protein N)